MDEVDLLLASLTQEFLDLITTIDEVRGNGKRRRSGRLRRGPNQCMATLEAKPGGWRIAMLTLTTNKFRLQRPATIHAESGIIGKFSLALRTLHQAHPPRVTVYDRQA